MMRLLDGVLYPALLRLLMTNKVVLLTGSKNNAGDYLIKYRAKELLAHLRTDRELVDYDAWVELDDEKLAVINQSSALILTGGPSLQKNMYPGIYNLCENLDEIKVPILTMGIGWKSLNGGWQDTRDYRLSDSSIELLKRINSQEYFSSVRDYHTLNTLQSHGFENFVMTGCPATYELNSVNLKLDSDKPIKKIGFSLGVSFLMSHAMEKQMKNLILGVRDAFSDSELCVAFHHGTSKEFLKTHNATNNHLLGHQKFIHWLTEHNIGYQDISGSAEGLIGFYDSCDIHIGYRVHAHIYMTSIAKPSILIAEDGRGLALKDVFGGAIFPGFDRVEDSLVFKVLRRLKLRSGFSVTDKLVKEVLGALKYELANDFPLNRSARASVGSNFQVMKRFVAQIP